MLPEAPGHPDNAQRTSALEVAGGLAVAEPEVTRSLRCGSGIAVFANWTALSLYKRLSVQDSSNYKASSEDCASLRRYFRQKPNEGFCRQGEVGPEVGPQRSCSDQGTTVTAALGKRHFQEIESERAEQERCDNKALSLSERSSQDSNASASRGSLLKRQSVCKSSTPGTDSVLSQN